MLSIIGIVVMIVVTYRVFQAAKDTGRNGVLWAFATVGIGLGFQFVIPIMIGIVLGIIYMSQGQSVETIQQNIMGPAIIISIGSLILSVVGMLLVLKHVSKLPPDDHDAALPPPPPTFDRPE